MNSDSECYLICRFKSDSFNIICQSVWIFFQNAVNSQSVFLINLDCQIDGNPLFLQINHCLSEVFLFFYLYTDFPGLSLTDSLDFRQPLRLFLHNAEGVFSKFRNDLSCKRRPNPLHSTGSKIPLNGFPVLRLLYLVLCHLKLQPVRRMHDILSFQFQKFPIPNVRKFPDTGYFPVLIMKLKYRITILLVSENNMVNVSRY